MIIDLQVDDVAYLYATSQPNVVEFLEEIREGRNEEGKPYLFPVTNEIDIRPIHYNGLSYALMFEGHSSLVMSASRESETYYFALAKEGFSYVYYMEEQPKDDGGYFTQFGGYLQYVSGFDDD